MHSHCTSTDTKYENACPFGVMHLWMLELEHTWELCQLGNELPPDNTPNGYNAAYNALDDGKYCDDSIWMYI